jgi:hypothetical protein
VTALLSWLVRRAMRRGLAGEPVWLAVGAAAWLIRKASEDRQPVVWRGTVRPGDRLSVRSWLPGDEQQVRDIVITGAPGADGRRRGRSSPTRGG